MQYQEVVRGTKSICVRAVRALQLFSLNLPALSLQRSLRFVPFLRPVNLWKSPACNPCRAVSQALQPPCPQPSLPLPLHLLQHSHPLSRNPLLLHNPAPRLLIASSPLSAPNSLSCSPSAHPSSPCSNPLIPSGSPKATQEAHSLMVTLLLQLRQPHLPPRLRSHPRPLTRPHP